MVEVRDRAWWLFEGGLGWSWASVDIGALIWEEGLFLFFLNDGTWSSRGGLYSTSG